MKKRIFCLLFSSERGVSFPFVLITGFLLISAVALPFATKLVEERTVTRQKAASDCDIIASLNADSNSGNISFFLNESKAHLVDKVVFYYAPVGLRGSDYCLVGEEKPWREACRVDLDIPAPVDIPVPLPLSYPGCGEGIGVSGGTGIGMKADYQYFGNNSDSTVKLQVECYYRVGESGDWQLMEGGKLAEPGNSSGTINCSASSWSTDFSKNKYIAASVYAYRDDNNNNKLDDDEERKICTGKPDWGGTMVKVVPSASVS